MEHQYLDPDGTSRYINLLDRDPDPVQGSKRPLIRILIPGVLDDCVCFEEFCNVFLEPTRIVGQNPTGHLPP